MPRMSRMNESRLSDYKYLLKITTFKPVLNMHFNKPTFLFFKVVPVYRSDVNIKVCFY